MNLNVFEYTSKITQHTAKFYWSVSIKTCNYGRTTGLISRSDNFGTKSHRQIGENVIANHLSSCCKESTNVMPLVTTS